MLDGVLTVIRSLAAVELLTFHHIPELVHCTDKFSRVERSNVFKDLTIFDMIKVILHGD